MIFQDRFVRKISAQDYLQLSLKFNMMLQKKKKKSFITLRKFTIDKEYIIFEFLLENNKEKRKWFFSTFPEVKKNQFREEYCTYMKTHPSKYSYVHLVWNSCFEKSNGLKIKKM